MAHRTADATVAAHGAVTITPHDTNSIPATRAIYVGGSGNIVATMVDGMDCTFSNVPIGIFPIQVTRVKSTSTTATLMIALY